MIGTARKFALAMFLAASAGSAHAEQEALGRLFFTPEERSEFDRQRQFHLERRTSLPDEAAAYTVNGIVRRHDGRQITWINGTPVEGAAGTADDASRLRAGETIFPGSGERRDILGTGRIIVNRPDSKQGK